MTIENSVMDHKNKTIQNGYRTTQPLNNRMVEANFQYFPDQCECVNVRLGSPVLFPLLPGPLWTEREGCRFKAGMIT